MQTALQTVTEGIGADHRDSILGRFCFRVGASWGGDSASGRGTVSLRHRDFLSRAVPGEPATANGRPKIPSFEHSRILGARRRAWDVELGIEI